MKGKLKSYTGDVYLIAEPKEEELSHDCFLRIGEVLRRVGFSSRTLYRKMNDESNRFPRQIKIGRVSVWSEREVVAWMDAQRANGGLS